MDLQHALKTCMHAGGRGRGDFDDRPPPRFGPDREAQLGSAARPGEMVPLQGRHASAQNAERAFTEFPKALQVQITEACSAAAQLCHVIAFFKFFFLFFFCFFLVAMTNLLLAELIGEVVCHL